MNIINIFKTTFPFVFILLTCGGCGGRNTQPGEKTIVITGAFGLQPMVTVWAERFTEAHPNVSFDISGGGAGKGMTDVLMGMNDIAMLSRPLTEDEKSQGAVIFSVAKDAVVAIVNTENPHFDKIMARGISSESARKIWIDKSIRTWGQFLNTGDNTPLIAFSRFDAGGGPDTWAAWFNAKHIDLAGPKVFGDLWMLDIVQNAKNGLGFISMTYAYDQTTGLPSENVAVLPVDANGNGVIEAEENVCGDIRQLVAAIGSGVYPVPPARDLYLVTKGVPDDPMIAAFIEFVLTEGQKYNLPTGFVGATDDEIAEGLKLLEME